jgi:hypothetical protein
MTDDDDDDDVASIPMLNLTPDACRLFLHIGVKVSNWCNMSTVTVLQIFIFKMTVL